MIVPALPRELGFSQIKYPSWRPYQVEAISTALANLKTADISVLDMPVGTGKTLVALSIARMFLRNSGQFTDSEFTKVVILTGTKGLQDQYQEDVKGSLFKVTDVRGANNYNCLALNKKEFSVDIIRKFHTTTYSAKCDHGPCTVKIPCGRKEDGCLFYGTGVLGEAKRSNLLVTNYSMWLLGVLGDADLVICDEGHLLEAEIDKAARIQHPDIPFQSIGKAQLWGAKKLEALLKKDPTIAIKNEIRVIKKLLNIGNPENWRYVSDGGNSGWAPINHSIEGNVLAESSKKFVIMSGTTSRVDVSRFVKGVSSKKLSWVFNSYPSQFDVENRLLICYPLRFNGKGVGVTYKISPVQEQLLLEHQIKIIKRMNPNERKGIVHSVSYTRAKQIVEAIAASEITAKVFFADNARVLSRTLQEFKASKGGILISPSVTTGFDFAGDLARWQLIAKVPFANTTNAIVKARTEMDPNYSVCQAIKVIDQAVGRGTRSREDWCETYITDANAMWVIFAEDGYGNFLAPERLRESFKVMTDEAFNVRKVRVG